MNIKNTIRKKFEEFARYAVKVAAPVVEKEVNKTITIPMKKNVVKTLEGVMAFAKMALILSIMFDTKVSPTSVKAIDEAARNFYITLNETNTVNYYLKEK